MPKKKGGVPNKTPAQRGKLANFGNKMANPMGKKHGGKIPSGGSLSPQAKKKRK